MRLRAVVTLGSAGAVALAAALVAGPAASADSSPPAGTAPRIAGAFSHLVVIYEENHSFDNLYGGWGTAGRDKVEGIDAAPAQRTVQVAQDGTPLPCLPQNDVNLVDKGPLATTCSVPVGSGQVSGGRFPNEPFVIDQYIPPTATTCPPEGVSAPNGVREGSGEPGGCTRDIVHRFYQEQYQIDHGRQDRYVTGSDAMGLVMGRYDTKTLPVYRYLNGAGAPNYVVADHFFQAAFGGSFLNHQWLVAARSPVDPTGGAFGGAVHSQLDTQGFPSKSAPLYVPTLANPVDGQLTQACDADGKGAVPTLACGNYAVNTVQPASPPFGKGPQIPLIDDSRYPNIGDRLTAAGVSWNWYSGGWDAAAAGKPGPLFQFHHQPLNYFAAYAPGTPGRAHLQDEQNFLAAAKDGTLPTVSFVKPYGAENEHPGYASEQGGSDHLVDLLQTITTGPQAKDTLVVVTYDEFGGQWDHVPPPGSAGRHSGVHDAMGPGTRIPALLVSAAFTRDAVDHTTYDTTSILATLEHSLHLAPLSKRDARVADLGRGVRKGLGLRR